MWHALWPWLFWLVFTYPVWSKRGRRIRREARRPAAPQTKTMVITRAAPVPQTEANRQDEVWPEVFEDDDPFADLLEEN